MLLAQAVSYAHEQGVLHRDLKPGNVLLSEDDQPKIADFGLAKFFLSDQSQTATGCLVGTPSYMAPEQAMGSKDVGPAADVYALGAIMYEMLTGRPPFQGETALDTLAQVAGQDPIAPSRLRPNVPRDLETICLKCLLKEPSRRYSTAAELAEDLRRFLAGEPINARPVGAFERLWRWRKRNPGIANLALALTVAVLVAFGLVTSQWRRADAQRQVAEAGWAEADLQRQEAERQESEANRQRDVANRQRQRAEINFRQARRAVDDLLIRVSQTTLLDAPGLQPLRETLLEAALAYYKGFLKQNADDPALRVELAATYLRVAHIYHGNDRNDDALAALRDGLGIVQSLLDENALVGDLPGRLAGLFTSGGRRLHRATAPPTDPDGARDCLEQMAKTWERLAEENPKTHRVSERPGVHVSASGRVGGARGQAGTVSKPRATSSTCAAEN